MPCLLKCFQGCLFVFLLSLAFLKTSSNSLYITICAWQNIVLMSHVKDTSISRSWSEDWTFQLCSWLSLHLHFIWKYDDDLSSQVVFQKKTFCCWIYRAATSGVSHTCAMRQSLFAKFGRVSPSVQPAVLRYFYWDLTGDSSASCNLREAEIDSRVSQVLDMEPEDPQTVIDLHSLNSSVERAKYNVFWDHCSQYLNESIGTAVDYRRHCEVVHLAQAILFKISGIRFSSDAPKEH